VKIDIVAKRATIDETLARISGGAMIADRKKIAFAKPLAI
jgi:hypothetical protein